MHTVTDPKPTRNAITLGQGFSHFMGKALTEKITKWPILGAMRSISMSASS